MITYSFKPTKEQYDFICKLADDFFKSPSDPNQASSSDVPFEMLEKVPHMDQLIFDNNKLIGFTGIMPCDKKHMDLFINGKIDEPTLVNAIRFEITEFNCLYLIAAIILPEYQKQGIVTTALKRHIEQLKTEYPIEEMFTWTYTAAGEKLAQKFPEYNIKIIKD